MADPIPPLLLQMQGWAGQLEANHEDAMRWIAEFLHGHPRAQDFEPTGRGGSDPTLNNGIRPDDAAKDGKAYEKHIRAAWRNLDAAVHISNRYRTATRPKRKPDDAQDVWCVLHLELDAHEPRYRNDLCRPCTERKYQTGDYPTLDDVRYHSKHGRWPRRAVDPKQRIASADRLALTAETLTAEQAAEIIAS